MIKDIDDNSPDPVDIVDIQESKCINCGQHYNGVADIIFTKVGEWGRLIWWHSKKCYGKKTQSN